MRAPYVVLLCAVAGAAIWFGLLARPKTPPLPPADVPESAGGNAPEPGAGGREAVLAVLVIRVRTQEGGPAPEGTQAGYLVGRMERVKGAAPDGTFRFADAPVGELELIAKADGYELGSGRVRVVSGVPNEAIVTLVPSR